jgi:hypothetical protein
MPRDQHRTGYFSLNTGASHVTPDLTDESGRHSNGLSVNCEISVEVMDDPPV